MQDCQTNTQIQMHYYCLSYLYRQHRGNMQHFYTNTHTHTNTYRNTNAQTQIHIQTQIHTHSGHMQDCQIKATIGKVLLLLCTILSLANHDLFQEEDRDVGDIGLWWRIIFYSFFCSILIIIMIQILKNTKNVENTFY